MLPLRRLPPARRQQQASVAELRGWSAAHTGHQRGRGQAMLCVCVRSIRATCRVVSIGSPISIAIEQKRSKDDPNKKLNTSFTNRKSESNLKTWNLSAKNKKLADVSYCTQQFRLCWTCETLIDWHIHKYTEPLITLMAIQWLAERTQKVEPRRLLLSTGRIQSLCINALITRLSYTMIS